MKEYVKVNKLFFAWQYEQEEEWLREMSNKGYEFVSWSIFTYKFRKIEPKDVIYKFDYSPWWCNDSDENTEFIKECGWELCETKCGWKFYRCDADKCVCEDIYSDKEGKLQIIKRFRRFLIVLTIIEAILLFLGFILPIIESKSLDVMNIILWIIIILEFSIININTYVAYKKKKKGL